MEITKLSSDSKEHVFTISNIELPYINGIRRIVLGELPSYAIDHVKIIENTGKVNNDKLTTKINLLPVNQPIAVSVKYKNDGLVPVDVTSSDLVLYHVGTSKFQKYMEDAFHRNINVKNAMRHKIVGNTYVTPIVANSNKYTCDERVKAYIDEQDDENPEELRMEQDIHLITLDVGESIDLYGISFPGKPHDNVKYQQGNAFFRVCKKVVCNDLDWKKHIIAIIDLVTTIKTKEEYDKHKILIDKILYTTNNYAEYTSIKFTPAYTKKLKIETKNIIRDTCKQVYNGEIETYDHYNRCMPCLQKIAYILNIDQSVLYTTECLPKYQFTLRTNTIPCVSLWNKSRKLLGRKCSKFLSNIKQIVKTGVVKHGSMEHGYYVNFPDTTHTMGNIMVHELLKEDSLDICSYVHEHPLHTNIRVVLKFKKQPKEPEQALLDVFQSALSRSVEYIRTIPKIH